MSKKSLKATRAAVNSPKGRSAICAAQRDADEQRALDLIRRRGGTWRGSQTSLAREAAKVDRFLDAILRLRRRGLLEVSTVRGHRYVRIVTAESSFDDELAIEVDRGES